MVSHFGFDGEWGRMSHLSVSSCRSERHAACHVAFVRLFQCKFVLPGIKKGVRTGEGNEIDKVTKRREKDEIRVT